mgnify:CR=1|jgi:hypothetical protein
MPRYLMFRAQLPHRVALSINVVVPGKIAFKGLGG